ncbi:hypothetical protein Taro_006682 [Colocasia esculenta]|uniref:Uncharacterized protein n=1 Tax=Colocasia esculenta TaxID=4460 RepID=A0A843TYB0_COLES|nr:hypothetical protein [Colocasia esculenta]
MWEIFHKLRMNYDTYSVVADPLRWICLVSLETPDVEDIPQTELSTGEKGLSTDGYRQNSGLLDCVYLSTATRGLSTATHSPSYLGSG